MFLGERKDSWEKEKKSVSVYDQINQLPSFKEKFPIYKNIYSMVLQEIAFRVDFAFKGFFRRCKKGEKFGYPRFKSWDRYNSFTYIKSGFKIMKGVNKVYLSKIGDVRIIYDRPIIGEIKTCTVKKTLTDKWYVMFSCEIFKPILVKKTKKTIGIDVGLEYFVTLSDGTHVENPRFFRKEEKILKKAQQRLSSQKKGTFEWYKKRKVISRVHERIKNKRHSFIHQLSRKFVNEFDVIIVEDLNINDMTKDNYRCINKSIGDAAWRMLIDCISYKAEEAGKKLIKVNPAYTSQTCSKCGYREKKPLSDRIHKCSCCGLKLQRDHNAAINILTLGTQGLVSA